AECEHLTNEANTAMNRNFDAWPIFGRRINQEPEHVMALRSFDAHADYLLDWLKNRRDWLTKTYQTEASFAKARER
ncbi:MAG: hypothetical protein MJ175_09550, partial [Clostridia bacterium]|nr:hypothetical protein [Clostridia bacterium]